MNVRYLFLGLIFLFNPNYAAFDILPDFIGYILIYRSLLHISLIQPTLQDARDGFRSLIFASLGKTALFLVLFTVQSSSAGTYDRGYDLALAFGFGLIELWLSAKAFPALIDGTDSALTVHGTPCEDSSRGNALAMTWIFIIAKNALCVAAELPFLWETKTTGSLQAMDRISLGNLRYILTLLNLGATTVLGIIWLIILWQYFRHLKDRSFKQNIQNSYLTLLAEKPRLLLSSRLSLCYKLTGIGMVCMFSFTAWNVNVIPSALFGVFTLICLFIMNRVIPHTGGMQALKLSPAPFITGAAFTVVSALQYAVSIYIFSLYHSSDEAQSYADILFVVTTRDSTAAALMTALFILTFCEAALFLLYFRSLCSVLRSCAKKYTPTRYETAQMQDRNEIVYKGIDRALKLTTVWAVLLSLSCVLQQALLYVFPLMWFISMLASVCFLICGLRAVNLLAEETENRFMYE